MNPLSHRRIIITGYTTEAAPVMLGADGLPMGERPGVVRFMVAFWIPQKPPYQRRAVGTHADFLKSEVRKMARASGTPAPALDHPATLAEYVNRFGLHTKLLYASSIPPGFTMVVDARDFELAALRDGAIVEQIQDFTFERMPNADEIKAAMLPHWDMRTLESLGYLPNPSAAPKQPGQTTVTFEQTS